MAEYKVVDADQLDADLVTVADGIRSISGNAAALSFPSGLRAETEEAVAEIAVQADLIEQIKAALDQEPVKQLPDGYTELEWIESTGTQYIDSEVYGESGVIVEMEFELVDTATGVMIGAFETNKRLYPIMIDNGVLKYAYGAIQTTGSAANTGKTYTVISSLSAGAQNLVVEGSLVTGNGDGTEIDTGKNLFIFAHSYTNGGVTGYAKMRLKQCKIRKNNVLVRNFIPCTTASQGAGLYDLVSSRFFGNLGSGTFVAGSEVVAA